MKGITSHYPVSLVAEKWYHTGVLHRTTGNEVRETTAGERPTLPLGEILDRLTILMLYKERATEKHDPRAYSAYVGYVSSDSRLSSSQKEAFMDRLLKVNGKMWYLEAAIRSPGDMSLEDIGRIAVKLRDLNSSRNKIKAELDELADQSALAALGSEQYGGNL
jgi:hypothetical protein